MSLYTVMINGSADKERASIIHGNRRTKQKIYFFLFAIGPFISRKWILGSSIVLKWYRK